MLRLWGKYLKPYWFQVTILVVFQIAQSVLNLYLPNLQADIIDNGVAAGDKDAIYRYGFQMIGISVVQILANLVAVYYSTRLAMRLGYETRRDIFSAVEDMSLQEVERFSAGSLITRTTNDVQQVQMTTMQMLLIVLQAPVQFVGGVILAFRQDRPLTWSLAVILPVVLVIAGILMSKMGPLFGKMQRRLDAVNRLVREQISGVRVIRAFVRERSEAQRFHVANRKVYDTLMSTGRLMSMMIPLLFFIINLSNVGIMWFGGKRIESGGMQIGSLQAFIQYLMIILIGLMMAAMMMVMVPRASVASKRITEVMEAKSSITAPEHPYVADAPLGKVEFRHVGFSYPGADDPVLDDLSFTAEPGTTTAIIGSTGSGKSTVLRLMNRMFDVNSGGVLIDGHDVREYDPAQLNLMFGQVPQKAMLFSGTIRSNMQYGAEHATDDDIWQALRIAQAEEFVRENPQGLDAPVSEGGTNFSGGQKQRLCIARAILRQPLIYTFDDAFSALDVATDRKLREALASVTRHATQILVAQRATSIRDADQILVFESGRIVGRGTHDELMNSCPTYQEIVESQGGLGPDVEALSLDGRGE
ncbi:MAG: ABC transporter ATP-binding protein/permease [Bifidobacterium crudilactis]|jgi:ATP-binding cassette subfamily B protein|nr:ABC transporter ATP-binding protein/permease [Bifidobacterium crudilactis]MCI1890200.1 ABC transporter ATP-binding protein/permease [Bifidobacterium crudilactis]